MVEDRSDQAGLGDESEDLHHAAALVTGQGVLQQSSVGGQAITHLRARV